MQWRNVLLDVTKSDYYNSFPWVLDIDQHVGDLGSTQFIKKKTGSKPHDLIERLSIRQKILGTEGLLNVVKKGLIKDKEKRIQTNANWNKSRLNIEGVYDKLFCGVLDINPDQLFFRLNKL